MDSVNFPLIRDYIVQVYSPALYANIRLYWKLIFLLSNLAKTFPGIEKAIYVNSVKNFLIDCGL
jgi:hypothetical protein